MFHLVRFTWPGLRFVAGIFLFVTFFGCDSQNEVTVIDPALRVAEADKLLWPVPANRLVIEVPFEDRQQRIVLDDAHDFRLVLPEQPLTHRLDIVGGRNVSIIGGAFHLKGYDDLDTNRAALAFWNGEHSGIRTIHIEGIHFDMSEARDRDALAFNDEYAIFQVQNVRFENINGDHLGLHPDAIENWGGAKEIRIYKATVITDHQGFLLSPLQPTQINPTEFVNLQKIDFKRNAGEYGVYPNHKCPIYLWLVHYMHETCETYERGAFLSEVYALHADNCWDFGMNDAMPNTIQPAGCLAVVSQDSSEMSWPSLPFEGAMKQGVPPDGEFVPAGVAGIDYNSPGYKNKRVR